MSMIPNGARWILPGLAAASLYLLLTVPNLDAVGLYYDEVNQAPAAFAYVGRTPTRGCALSAGPVPVLNASYIGALKSGVYGLYMRMTGNPFSAHSWRMTGLLLVSAGLVAFSAAAAGALGPGPLALFFILLLTDANFLLNTRHDYGPAALCFLLRLLFLSAWLAPLAPGAAAARRRAALMGVFIGVALFEKATAVVLLPALLAGLAWGPGRTERGRWLAAAAGLAAGLIPLAAANLYTLLAGRGFISLTPIAKPWRGLPSALEAFAFFRDYLGSGQGLHAAWTILDVRRPSGLPDAEAVLLTLLLGLILYQGLRRGGADEARDAPASAAAFLGVGAALLLLPYRLDFHHLVIGTPFQYLALALWSRQAARRTAGRGRWARLLPYLPALLLLLRLPGLAAVGQAQLSGRTGVMWDRSFTTVAEFAARSAPRAVFVAADWGFANQIYCLSQAREGVVFEPFWEDGRPGGLDAALAAAEGRTEIYVLTRRFRPPLRPERTRAVLSAIAGLPGWAPVEVEPELAASPAINVLKYARRDAAAAAIP